MDKEQLEQFRGILINLRTEIGGEYERAVETTNEQFGDSNLPDANEEASRTIERRLHLQMSDKNHQTLTQIEDALDRINDGEYGICLECGEDILPARLQLIPYARFCVECKENIERGTGQTG